MGWGSGSQVGLDLEESGFTGENQSKEGGPRKAPIGVSTGQSNAVLYPGVSLRGHQARYKDICCCYDGILLASRRWGPGMLLDTPQYPGQPHRE